MENGCFGDYKSLATGHVCAVYHVVEFVPKVAEVVLTAPELHASGST